MPVVFEEERGENMRQQIRIEKVEHSKMEGSYQLILTDFEDCPTCGRMTPKEEVFIFLPESVKDIDLVGGAVREGIINSLEIMVEKLKEGRKT